MFTTVKATQVLVTSHSKAEWKPGSAGDSGRMAIDQ